MSTIPLRRPTTRRPGGPAAWRAVRDRCATPRAARLPGPRDGAPDAGWDIGVLTDGGTDIAALAGELSAALGTDAVDVVELERASALLRYRAARDGIPLLERPAGSFERFQLEAVLFWCDAGPVIRAAQDDVLAALG